MSKKVNYFKIGSFVLGGAALLVIGVIMLGAGEMFKKGITIETYFDGSVEGLDVGSPLKLRGVSVGNVKEISFVGNKYRNADPNFARYILVRMEVSSALLEGRAPRALEESLETQIEKGLRLRLTSSGITGISFLEADYLDPAAYPPPKINWAPGELYIPSAPSRISAISASVERFAKSLEKTDIEAIARNVETVLASTSQAVSEANIAGLSDELRSLLAETRETNRRFQAFMDKPEFQEIPASAQRTMARAEQLVATTEEDVKTMLAELRQASADLSELSGRLRDNTADGKLMREFENFQEIMRNIREASESLPAAVTATQDTLIRLEQNMNSHQDDVTAIIRNLRESSENVRSLTINARDYPSYILLGDAPKPIKEHKP